MSVANPLWGAPRIHGELLKLGIDIGQTSVAKYMARGRAPPSQGWKTFLRNHANGIAAMDLFVVPTLSFRLLYGLLIMGHGRRHIVVTGEQHLRHILQCYMEYYNAVRTHLSLRKDAPNGTAIQRHGRIEGRPMLGGLHRQYVRI